MQSKKDLCAQHCFGVNRSIW